MELRKSPIVHHFREHLMAEWNPKVNEIFAQAIEHSAAERREQYLKEACGGDDGLRRLVDELLRAHEAASGFLRGPGVAHTDDTIDESRELKADRESAVPRLVDEQLGTSIGPYKLVQQIGEGGMGAVYLAEQEKPVRRRVALKIIKPGMDTAQVVARFEAERQALAMMDHPSIARVFDGGVTSAGRPYFVMELVKGVPITEYCDTVHLTPRERLELFIPVCQAIQHAHQKGIIHRDVKPSNVLIAMQDGQAVPKVIDFGIAKAIDQRLTEKSLFTQHGAIVGTLEYMSPEQAQMSAMDVDTRTDIYALGVLLYELLTGSTPLERNKLRQSGYAEILKRIREEEPAKPSTRLSESKESLASVAAQRKTEPARLTRLMKGDLDWIVMKALEKDRTRRYETATGFARDIGRYLDGDAVEASPPSRTYRLGKFARKHRAALTTATAFALLLFAAAILSAGLAVSANRERVRAKIAEKLAKEQQFLAQEREQAANRERARAEKAEQSAKDQQARAQNREQMAIDAVKRFGDAVRETPELKNNATLAPLRARLLKEPHAFFLKLKDQLQADREAAPDSLDRLATASYELGELTSEIGNKDDAVRAYQESLTIRERLAREHPSVVRFRRDLATSHNQIAGQQHEIGQQAQSLSSHKQAIAIREQLVRDNGTATELQSDLAVSYGNIASVQRAMGRSAEALASYKSAIVIQDRLARDKPMETQFWNRLALSLNNIGLLQMSLAQWAEAGASLEQGRAIRERLVREAPADSFFRSDLARSHESIGTYLHRSVGRLAQAMDSRKRALAIREQLARENPSVTGIRRDLAASYLDIGMLQRAAGNNAEALASYEQAREIYGQLVRENPSVTQFQDELTGCHNNIGNVHRLSGRPVEAMASYEMGRPMALRLAREHPESPRFAHILGATLANIAIVLRDERRFDEARTQTIEAIEWTRKALNAFPNDPEYRQSLASHLTGLVIADKNLGRNDEAGKARDELFELIRDPTKSQVDERLAAILKGQAPANDTERLELANLAYRKGLHGTSARLFAQALTNDPKLGEDRQAQHAYDAACSAALAASGLGTDESQLDDDAKGKLRTQALESLKHELAAWNQALDADESELKAMVAPALRHWKTDTDLAGLRDQKQLAKLPEADRAAFTKLWADVDQLLTKAMGKK